MCMNGKRRRKKKKNQPNKQQQQQKSQNKNNPGLFRTFQNTNCITSIVTLLFLSFFFFFFFFFVHSYLRCYISAVPVTVLCLMHIVISLHVFSEQYLSIKEKTINKLMIFVEMLVYLILISYDTLCLTLYVLFEQFLVPSSFCLV